MNAQATSRAVFIVGSVLLVAWGLYATCHLPFTAISTDVWGAGYARVPRENLIGLCITASLWVAYTMAATIVGLLSRRVQLWQFARYATHLAVFGSACVLLLLPATFASVAVYNVVPTSTPYPDQVTPFVVAVGLVMLAISATLGILASRRLNRSLN